MVLAVNTSLGRREGGGHGEYGHGSLNLFSGDRHFRVMLKVLWVSNA